jgi:hypothetical protein
MAVGPSEFEVTIAVRVLADSEQDALEKLSRLIRVSYRFKYIIEVQEDGGE